MFRKFSEVFCTGVQRGTINLIWGAFGRAVHYSLFARPSFLGPLRSVPIPLPRPCFRFLKQVFFRKRSLHIIVYIWCGFKEAHTHKYLDYG